MWPAIFALSIKIQLYGYLYGNKKNQAIFLTLVLALLLQILSTKILGIDNRNFSLLV